MLKILVVLLLIISSIILSLFGLLFILERLNSPLRKIFFIDRDDDDDVLCFIISTWVEMAKKSPPGTSEAAQHT